MEKSNSNPMTNGLQNPPPPPPKAVEPPPPAPIVGKRVIWGSRSVDMFTKIEQIGEGTYGKVYMARNKETGEIVALKKIRMDNEKEGFPITAIREIKILKELHHENVVQLKEIVTSKATKENKGKQSIYMVFEYMDHDLTGLTLSESNLWNPTQAQIKCYMKQLLEGLHYCHKSGVLHRDIKGSNLLISNSGQLKLADFGLARPFTEQICNYTNRVITLWYRPPELLLGAVQYGPAIDMWCILAELLAKRPIFPGKNEIDELDLIFKLCGTPTEQTWADLPKMPWYGTFKPLKVYKKCLGEVFKSFPPEALDLVSKMLELDPKKRITAEAALDHNYFWCEPYPCSPSELPKFPSSHEFQAKKRRQNGPAADVPKRHKGMPGEPVGGNMIPGAAPVMAGPRYDPRAQSIPQRGYGPPGQMRGPPPPPPKVPYPHQARPPYPSRGYPSHPHPLERQDDREGDRYGRHGHYPPPGRGGPPPHYNPRPHSRPNYQRQ